jgi:hypothetical protein
MNAHEIVQFHRTSERWTNLPQTAWTLAAAIEHVVCGANGGAPAQRGQSDPLLDALLATNWPSTHAKSLVEGDTNIVMLPAQYDLVVLRRLEANLRSRMIDNGFTPTTAKALTGAVSEIIDNVWEHAEAMSPGLLAWQVAHARVSVGVADFGIGVLRSLQTNPQYAGLQTSMSAIKKAMTVGVTRTQEPTRGLGFDTVLRAVADQWGAVRLRTGQAILEFHGATNLRRATTSYGVELPGLQVVFSVGTMPPTTTITL